MYTSPFLGRAGELGELRECLRAARWTTVTGPGGVGKTRLAFEALREWDEPVIAVVPLDSVHEPGLVAAVVSQALGVRPEPGLSDVDGIVRALADRRGVILLDTCEHLTVAVAGLARRILASATQVTFAATSQAVVGVPGERVYRLQPLDTEAAAFFIAKARERQPDFAPGALELAAVDELCRRLEGWPLGLELAAGWMRVLTPSQLLDRWEDRYRLLVEPGLGSARQQSFAATVAWSAALLPGAARDLAIRLAVFGGPFTLADVEALDEPGSPDPAQPLRDLINFSWLEYRAADVPHFRMLGLLRDWGRDRLAEAGQLEDAQRRLASQVLALAEAGEKQNFRSELADWPQRLGLASGTIDAALTWSLSHDQAAAARIAISLLGWWRRSGRLAEGRRWYAEIAAAPGLDPALRARAQCAEALVAMDIADYPAVRELSGQALRVLQGTDDHRWTARALTAASTVAKYSGDTALARFQLEQAITYLERQGDQRELAVGYNNLGALAAEHHELDVAELAYRNSLRIKEELGDKRSIALTEANLGDVYTQLGRTGDADRILTRALATTREIKDDFLAAFVRINLGENQLAASGYASAAGTFRDALQTSAELQVPRFQALATAGLGRALYLGGDRIQGSDLIRHARVLALGAEDKLLVQDIDDKARAAGLDTADETAGASPGAGPGDAPRVAVTPGNQTRLTARQREILLRVAAGRSDKQIAVDLGIANSTVQRHLANIYLKLGADNRIEALRQAVALGALPPDSLER